MCVCHGCISFVGGEGGCFGEDEGISLDASRELVLSPSLSLPLSGLIYHVWHEVKEVRRGLSQVGCPSTGFPRD